MLFVPSVEYNIIAYTDSEGLCVCCDGYDRWFNVECTTIKKEKLRIHVNSNYIFCGLTHK